MAESHTVSFTASKLMTVRTPTNSNWGTYSGQCQQGEYNTSGSTTRVGAMLFPTLKDESWAHRRITNISLKITYSGSGAKQPKTLYFYAGTQTTLASNVCTGEGMLGSSIGEVVSNGNAYNGTRTNELSSGTVFDNFVNWITTGTSLTLALYTPERRGTATYSTNYLTITACVITVTYEDINGTVKYYDGSAWVKSEVYYYTGNEWVQTVPYYYNGSSWAEIGD